MIVKLYPIMRKALFSKDAEWSHGLYLTAGLQQLNHSPLRCLIKQDLPTKPVELFRFVISETQLALPLG